MGQVLGYGMLAMRWSTCKTQQTSADYLFPCAAQLLVNEFEGWASVRGDAALTFDWDDAAGDAARRERGLRLEKMRNAEMKRRRLAAREPGGAAKKRDVATLMPTKGQTEFDDTPKAAPKRDPTRMMPGKGQTDF